MKRLSTFYGCLLLSTFASMGVAKTLPSHCCPPLPDCPRYYIDLGVGQALNHQLGGDGFTTTYINSEEESASFNGTVSMHTQEKTRASHFLWGMGIVWPNIIGGHSPYLPFISLGLRYQRSPINRAKINMLFDGVFTSGASEPGEGGGGGGEVEESTAAIARADTQEGEDAAKVHTLIPYTFHQDTLAAEMKINLYRCGRWMPYLKLGLGNSWNQTRAQRVDLRIGDKEVKHQQVHAQRWQGQSFYYSMGLGVDVVATRNFWVGIGYQYENLGTFKLAQPTLHLVQEEPTTMSPKPPQKMFNLGMLKTHNVQITARYLFG